MDPRREGSKPMDTTTLVLAAVAAVLLAVAFWRGRNLPLDGIVAAGRTLWRNLPLLLLLDGWSGYPVRDRGVWDLHGC